MDWTAGSVTFNVRQTLKTIRPGPRPFVVFGIISLVICGFVLSASLKNGDWHDIIWALLFPALCFAPFAFSTLEYDQTEIRLKNYGIVWKRARFEDIGLSRAQTLAEKDWPLSITIFGKEDDRVLMTVRLKIWSKSDVTWLLARPELKLQK
jgi:hypothetical protein